MTKGYLGIDCGTQGLSVIFVDESLKVLGVGEGGYEMVPDLADDCYEQQPADWIAAMEGAMKELHGMISDMEVLAIGISGQMHGEVLADENGESLGPARLWCDGRNLNEGQELTALFGAKVPMRATAARWLWTIRNQPEKAKAARHMTTPAGWIAYCLTGDWTLGIGDAAGMFPIDQETLDYRKECFEKFNSLASAEFAPIETLLPTVRKAGEDAGNLNASGAQLLGLPEGIPVAPAEGDQPAALTGSLIADAGFVSCSFGTSVCANSVGDREFQGVSDPVDHFCAPDGKPINMVCLVNGTTYMNTVVEMFGNVLGDDRGGSFETLMPMLLDAKADCDGLLAVPFMDVEPGLGVSTGGSAMIYGLTQSNATPGNVAKSALLSVMFNLRLGSEELDKQGYPRSEIVLTGGLTKTPELGQVLADVFDTSVTLLDSSDEGTAWGAALMAKYRHDSLGGVAKEWSEFLSTYAGGEKTKFLPDAKSVASYEQVYQKYKQLVASHATISDALS